MMFGDKVLDMRFREEEYGVEGRVAPPGKPMMPPGPCSPPSPTCPRIWCSYQHGVTSRLQGYLADKKLTPP